MCSVLTCWSTLWPISLLKEGNTDWSFLNAIINSIITLYGFYKWGQRKAFFSGSLTPHSPSLPLHTEKVPFPHVATPFKMKQMFSSKKKWLWLPEAHISGNCYSKSAVKSSAQQATKSKVSVDVHVLETYGYNINLNISDPQIIHRQHLISWRKSCPLFSSPNFLFVKVKNKHNFPRQAKYIEPKPLF